MLMVLVLALAPVLAGPAAAQDILTRRLVAGLDIEAAFQPLTAPHHRAVVVIGDEDGERILGTIVHEDGWVLTKASPLPPRPVCYLASGDERAAEIVGVDETHDLALLRIPAGGLSAVTLAPEKEFEVGQWIVSVGPEPTPLGVGVVSVAPRSIPAATGFLGVSLEEADDGVKVAQVEADSAAARAGILVDDVIVKFQGTALQDRADLIAAIGSHAPGDEVTLEVRREGKTVQLKATLGARDEPEERPRRRRRRRAPQVSERRNGFPVALQHDTVLRPWRCGGPVLDVRGRVVGLNIARAGRTQTLAIPSPTLSRIFERLRTGRLATTGDKGTAEKPGRSKR